MKKKPLTDSSGEVRTLTRADLKKFGSASESLPSALNAQLAKRRPGRRGPQEKPTKDQITLRLDRDVVEHYKSTGQGWQSRINATLREAIKKTG